MVSLAIHVATLMVDRFARVSVASLIGLDPRPGVVIGACALWLAVALPLSFRLRQARFMSQRAWRLLHYFGYAVWGAALVHGVMAGTDARSPWALAVYATSAALVGASPSSPTPARSRRRESTISTGGSTSSISTAAS